VTDRRVARWIDGGAGEPAWNLALDEALLHGAGAVVRVYSWQPAGLSLGYFQRFGALDVARHERDGFVVVRRPTGGGAIAHHDELTFCVADDLDAGIFTADVKEGYRRIHAAFARLLERLGARVAVRGDALLESDRGDDSWLCFLQSSAVDLAARGRKLLGSAQRRVGRRVMHHGSLPLARNRVTPEAACVADEVGRAVPFAEVAAALRAELAAEFGLAFVESAPTAEERARAAELVATKYGQESWTRRR
jgi:lipoate-protein ligase A